MFTCSVRGIRQIRVLRYRRSEVDSSYLMGEKSTQVTGNDNVRDITQTRVDAVMHFIKRNPQLSINTGEWMIFALDIVASANKKLLSIIDDIMVFNSDGEHTAWQWTGIEKQELLSVIEKRKKKLSKVANI